LGVRNDRVAAVRMRGAVNVTYIRAELAELNAASNHLTSVDGRKPAIEAVNLTKKFGDRISVDRLNLKILQGELYSLLGDNGAGKTTTINMLTTLIKPSEGQFFISGFDGIKDSEKSKGAFGIVSQDVAIYHELTAYENLEFIANLYELPRAKAKSRIAYLLELSGLSDRANDIVGTFSGGMQRRLSIASALLHEPAVLFMDEPTVGLDPVARRQIWGTLSQLRGEGVTILLTTHYLDEAELLSDRIGIIRQGKLVAEGTFDQLRERFEAIRTIEVNLARRYKQEDIEKKLGNLRSRYITETRFDPVHNSVNFAQPHNVSLPKSLKTILNWLEEENIAFSKFSTAEPNLEEVFLALSGNKEVASSELEQIVLEVSVESEIEK
jgi:ABC-2 type transport system ATP-binding protein